MSIWRRFALIFYPTLFTAVLAGLGLLAWASVQGLAPVQARAAAAAGLGLLILAWLGAFVRLRRRYLWLAAHREEEPPDLSVMQWLEVSLGALSLAASAGLLSLAGLLVWHGGIDPADPWRGAPVAATAVVGLLAGYLLRGSCRRANLRRQAESATGLRLAPQPAANAGNQSNELPPQAS